MVLLYFSPVDYTPRVGVDDSLTIELLWRVLMSFILTVIIRWFKIVEIDSFLERQKSDAWKESDQSQVPITSSTLLIVLWVWNGCPPFLLHTCVSRCWEGSTYVASSCRFLSFLILVSTIPRYPANTSEPNLLRRIEDRHSLTGTSFITVEKGVWTCKLAREVLLYGWNIVQQLLYVCDFSISVDTKEDDCWYALLSRKSYGLNRRSTLSSWSSQTRKQECSTALRMLTLRSSIVCTTSKRNNT
jgi:hypothetical protein